MAKLWRCVILLIGFICVGRDQASASVELEEINERLSSVEASQNSLQQLLHNLEQGHARDMENVTQFCQAIKTRVEEHKEILQNIQQSLQDNVPRNNSLPAAGPCRPDVYTVLDDPWRAKWETLDPGEENMCDNDLQPGWYRFFLHGGNAVMPTTCVEDYHCQTHAPQWLDLQGHPLPEVGQETEARACANWVSECCYWESPITVRNCGGYFVYKLQPQDICNLAYCVERQE